MVELFVHQCRVFRLPTEASAAESALAGWRGEVGARQARRMSHLGILLTLALRAHSFADDPALIYSSTYTETRSLEKFIDSFPFASPLLFQMSIHPGGVQQAMIARQQAVSEFYPLAGIDQVVSQALRTAMISSRPRTIWAGGEERGTWLLDVKMASEETFAWALALDRDPTGAAARVSWSHDAENGQPAAAAPGTRAFSEALESRHDLSWETPGIGRFSWKWS